MPIILFRNALIIVVPTEWSVYLRTLEMKPLSFRSYATCKRSPVVSSVSVMQQGPSYFRNFRVSYSEIPLVFELMLSQAR